jgi:hypothetical protein
LGAGYGGLDGLEGWILNDYKKDSSAILCVLLSLRLEQDSEDWEQDMGDWMDWEDGF